MASKISKVNKKGMITIPKDIREHFNIEAGSEVSVMVINGEIRIIPILDFDELRSTFPSIQEMRESYQTARKEELELEN
ncbi:MAG: AbrB/MazE/SpoVT family DNA-binding domain-containing protein [Promethearchaeota archaeon]